MALQASPWPFEKLRTRLEDVDLEDGTLPAVLLCTGVMSPCHLGHTQMLWQAKQRLEGAGFAVLAAWLSPSGSPNGPQKPPAASSSFENPVLSSAFRLRLAELMVLGDDLVSISPWEAGIQGQGQTPSHVDVMTELQAALDKEFASEDWKDKVRVFIVNGSDEANAKKKGLTPKKLHGQVTVPRGEDALSLEQPYKLQFLAGPCPGTMAALSSTSLWQAIKGGDTAYVSSMMSEAAAQFILEGPSEAERAALATDFARFTGGGSASEGPWPGAKLMQRLPLVPDDKLLAVVVAGGSMSPAHRGHVLMLWQAKERLEQAGYAVAACWLLPSSEGAALAEAKATGAPELSAAFRQRVAELSVCDDELVSVASWESSGKASPGTGKGSSPAEIASQLQAYLPERFPCSLRRRPVHVFYAAGSDVAKKLGLYRGLQPASLLGVVVVPRGGDEPGLEKPHQMIYVADEISGESAAFTSTKLRQAIRDKDTVYAAQAMASAAGRFTLAPTSSERLAFEADYKRLGVAPPEPKQLDWAKERLKASLRAWVGPQGTIHGDDVARLLKMLDPSWNSKEMSALMIGAKVAADGYVVADDFVDWIFSCYSAANPS
jgi:nicotinic acid mononucleotide adenylyltransferase